MELTDVSKTALITLRCRVIESQKKDPFINDPMASFCLERLVSLTSKDEMDPLIYKKLPPALTNHIAIRARKYDSTVNEFISRNPGCTVINIGCGFDTRYWRIKNKECKYIELDLPELIDIKSEILKEYLNYELIGCSVLDTSWIDHVTLNGNKNFMIVAEGLFMYLPKDEVIKLFGVLSDRFIHSQVILEVVTESYTRGIMKRIVIMKMKREIGSEAGSSYNFGIKKATELESYGSGIKIINEWSYFDDPDMRPRILKYLDMKRKQWTVIASINENKILV